MSEVAKHASEPTANQDNINDESLISPDESNTNKGRGLLKVPSRSSSQKKQTSSAGTGLSGATASESRNSISGRSKDSKSSILGRQGNSSVSSKHTGGESDPTATPGHSQPSSPMQKRKKKSGGLLSFLGCCAAPDSGNDGEGEAENVHKLDKLPQRPATAKSWSQAPQEQQNASKGPNEKESQAAHTGLAEQASSPADADQIAPANGDASREFIAPAVTVEPPKKQTQDLQNPPDVGNTDSQDVHMHDAPASDTQATTIAPSSETDPKAPSSSPMAPEPTTAAVIPITEAGASAPEPQKWLLPPIANEHKGRKCLVLDLDETLVHSSFKILHQADFTIPVEIEGNYHNVYVIKRPGVDEFMKRVGELYEVVVFTASVSKYGDPLLDQLDIHNVVHHRLFRESCYNHQGNYVKDLSQVGRDLKDTIIIDNSPTSYIFHPQHAVPISSWFSDAHDNELLDLIPVLEDLAGPTVADVSLVLDVTL